LRRLITSSLKPSARFVSVESRDRLSKYRTAIELAGAGALRAAVRHGGGEPSAHCARAGWTMMAEMTRTIAGVFMSAVTSERSSHGARAVGADAARARHSP